MTDSERITELKTALLVASLRNETTTLDTGEVVDETIMVRRELTERIADLQRRLAEAEALLDPPVCRLQFPDGTVPGNVREAAETWHRVAMDFWADRDDLRRRLAEADATAALFRSLAENLWAGRPIGASNIPLGEVALILSMIRNESASRDFLAAVVACRDALILAIAECREHNCEYQHSTRATQFDAMNAALAALAKFLPPSEP